MIIDPEKEFIALREPVSSQRIIEAGCFHKSGIALMAEIDKQIAEAEKQ